MRIRKTLVSVALASLAIAEATTHSYVGAGGCESSNCHGGTTPLAQTQSRILGNEFATWTVADKHSHAYVVLSNARSKRMIEILKISDPTTDARCTVCHAVGSPQKSLSDGVACEACHGPASDWLGSHLQVKSNSPQDLAVTHADSVSKGMTDTKRLDVRAKMCLACHLGRGNQLVDHEIIAAGHPDLAFELDTFTVGQPAHHREPKPVSGNSLPRVRAWAVGQSAAMAEGMRLLAAHAASRWPEFSDLECYQCHHDLRADSWRIERGYDNRKPGGPQINLARFEVFRELVAVVAPDQAEALDTAMNRLSSLVADTPPSGAAIAKAAMPIEQAANLLTTRFISRDFDATVTREIVHKLGRDIQRIACAGVNSAEQATMSLDALTTALSPQDHASQQAVTALYNYLEHPSLYKPAEFVALYVKATAY